MKMLIFFVLGLLAVSGFAQQQYSFFQIHNYQHSTVLALKQQQSSKIVLNEYGKTISITNPTGLDLHYLYNGQELDKDLNIYFYPKRLYSAKATRFFQPDPMSQYFSSYSFVGGDPVNYVDLTGNQGKPLVLYNTNQTSPHGSDLSTLDIRKQVGDAHYHSLPDFMNGKVGDLPEFNGTVFIDSHMGPQEGGLIELEGANRFVDLKSPIVPEKTRIVPNLDHYTTRRYRPKFTAEIRAESLGEELRNFADARGLVVKNIVAGGCQSETAAKQLGKGFTAKPSGGASKAKLRTVGVDNDLVASYYGDHTLASSNFKSIGETRLYMPPAQGFIENMEAEDPTASPKTFKDLWYADPETGMEDLAGYVGGEDLNQLVREARVPTEMKNAFATFEFAY